MSPWRQDMPLAGRRLLVVGEQGVGDEVMFAQPLHDLSAALGDSRRLTLAVDPRLVSLFARSFPNAMMLPANDVQPTITPELLTPVGNAPSPTGRSCLYWPFFANSPKDLHLAAS